VHWVPGDAVFMTGTPNVVPHAMLHNIKHNKVLHQRNILVTVVIEDVPFVAPEERITTETLAEHFFRIKIFYGFKDEMNVP
ncbi:KUP/HAK/KT family potassium transporter, partial [Stenotrophomonas maltophilia]